MHILFIISYLTNNQFLNGNTSLYPHSTSPLHNHTPQPHSTHRISHTSRRRCSATWPGHRKRRRYVELRAVAADNINKPTVRGSGRTEKTPTTTKKTTAAKGARVSGAQDPRNTFRSTCPSRRPNDPSRIRGGTKPRPPCSPNRNRKPRTLRPPCYRITKGKAKRLDSPQVDSIRFAISDRVYNCYLKSRTANYT